MGRTSVALLWAGAIGYASVIFVLSSQPVPAPAEETVALLGDKVLHALEYGGFSVLLSLAIATVPSEPIASRAAGIAFVAAVLYAASDEFHQTLVPGRQGDVADLAADAVGAFLGAVILQAWRWRSDGKEPVSETSPRKPLAPP